MKNAKIFYRKVFYRWQPETAVFFGLSAIGPNGTTPDEDVLMINEIRKRKYKILLIDDEIKFRKALGLLLKRRYEAEVVEADSGEEGIEKCKNDSFDFILIDIFLPAMNGIETYREIRKTFPRTSVIIMSARSDTPQWKEAKELSDISLMDKPPDREKLVKILFEDRGQNDS